MEKKDNIEYTSFLEAEEISLLKNLYAEIKCISPEEVEVGHCMWNDGRLEVTFKTSNGFGKVFQYVAKEQGYDNIKLDLQVQLLVRKLPSILDRPTYEKLQNFLGKL